MYALDAVLVLGRGRACFEGPSHLCRKSGRKVGSQRLVAKTGRGLVGTEYSVQRRQRHSSAHLPSSDMDIGWSTRGKRFAWRTQTGTLSAEQHCRAATILFPCSTHTHAPAPAPAHLNL